MQRFLIILVIASTANQGFSQDKTEAAIKLLTRMDTNKDGKLSQDEIPSSSRAAVLRIANEAGLDPSKSISLSKLERRLEKDRKTAEKGESKPNTTSSPKTSRGFGTSDSKTSKSSRGFSPESGSSRDPRVKTYVESMFRSSDKNKNGFIDGDELKSIRTKDDPTKWDANKDGRLSKSEVTKHVAGDKSKSKSSGSSFKSSNSTTTRNTATSKKTSSSNRYQDRYKRYAANLIKRYDKNKNNFLERDEWGKVSKAEEADKNRDGVLTVDEFAEHLKGMSSSSSSSKKKETKSTSKSSKSEKREERSSRDDRKSRRRTTSTPSDGVRRSYRARSAEELLPSGLGSLWDKDKNGNGQIEMSEFTSSWTDSKAREFVKLDLNDDGVLTAQEYLKSKSD